MSTPSRLRDRHLSAKRRRRIFGITELVGIVSGLSAIDPKASLHQLVMGVSAPRTDNIQRLLMPLQAVGRSLRKSDFRRRFGVQVIALGQPEGTIPSPPDPPSPWRMDRGLVAVAFG